MRHHTNLITGRQPIVSHLHVWGCTTNMKQHNNNTSLNPTSDKCILVGYTSTIHNYKVMNRKFGTIHDHNNIEFNENELISVNIDTQRVNRQTGGIPKQVTNNTINTDSVSSSHTTQPSTASVGVDVDEVEYDNDTNTDTFMPAHSDALIPAELSKIKLTRTDNKQHTLKSNTQHNILRQLLSELAIKQKQPTTLYCDNLDAVTLTHNPVHYKLSKHIDIRYHRIRDEIRNNTLSVSILMVMITHLI